MDQVTRPLPDGLTRALDGGLPDGPGGSRDSSVALRRSHRLALVATSALVVVAIAASAALVRLRSPAGHVYFSASAYDQSSGRCQFTAPITAASSTETVWLIAYFDDTVAAGSTYSLAITRDGAAYRSTGQLQAAQAFQCYVEQGAIGPLDPGVYRFTFSHDGKVEADGSITIR